MSRKANSGYDYDDDYDDYDEWEDCVYGDDDDHHAKKGEAAAMTRVRVKPGVWACSICTYDNHEGMTYCEICGILRSSPSCSESSIDMKSGEASAGAPTGFAEKNAALTTQSNAKEIGSTIASKGRTIPLVEKSSTSTSNVSRKIDVVEDPLNSGRSDSFSTRKSNSKDIMPESNSLANGGKPESVSNGLENISLNMKPGSSKSILPKKALTQYKPESWMLPEKESSLMTQLNLAIVGHVDSGKSTLSGRLLHLLGQISQKQMHKFEKEAKQLGKGSFAYAWALDESSEERERGITITVAVAYFDTKKYHVVVLDSPGHKDFVPNMISGATQADAAILVIDASLGAYETGMDSIEGQSREHAQLIRSFGVDQITVAINKMDVVAYSYERFDIIKQQVASFLRHYGFKESFISWIPVSAMENQNLVESASDAHLIKFMVLVMPMGDVATIRSIECNSQPCTVAREGQNVAVVLQGINITHVRAGGVLCHPDFSIKVALQGDVCVEDFSIYKALGRVFLRQSGRTIAVGVVTQVFED